MFKINKQNSELKWLETSSTFGARRAWLGREFQDQSTIAEKTPSSVTTCLSSSGSCDLEKGIWRWYWCASSFVQGKVVLENMDPNFFRAFCFKIKWGYKWTHLFYCLGPVIIPAVVFWTICTSQTKSAPSSTYVQLKTTTYVFHPIPSSSSVSPEFQIVNSLRQGPVSYSLKLHASQWLMQLMG